MNHNVKKDQEKLGQLHDAMTKMVEDANSAGRNMDSEENAKFDSLIEEHGNLEQAIERKLRLAGITKQEVEKVEQIAERKGESVDQVMDFKEQSRKAYLSYLRHGLNGMSQKEIDVMKRAQSSSVDSEGGYTVDEAISDAITKSMANYGGMREVCTVITTDKGGVLNFPTNNDVANTGEWLAENGAASAQDTVFGNVALNAWKASSDYMLISRELMQDSKFDIEGYVNELIAERLGRLTNAAYTVGDASSKPNGVRDASTAGAVTDVTAVVDFDDLLDLKHSVDRDYRQNAVWMLNDTVLRDLKKTAIASANQSLWQPGIVGGEPATIDGQRYVINNDLPDVAADSHSVLYGDFSKYIIRDVTGIEILRSDQLNMLKNQITLVGFMRTDGDLIDTAAVKHLRTLGT